jgi:cation-dependent mannose-6-phosphate receptor
MRLLSSPTATLALLSLASSSLAAEADKTTTTAPCTATSTSGSFYDLRLDIAVKAPADGSKPAHSNGAPTVDYHARGYDYGSNFTMNLCGPVVGKIDNVIGIDKGTWQNISAYYVSKGDVYSLGYQSGELKPRGKKLVLQYSGGSPCGKNEKRDLDIVERSSVHTGAAYKYSDYEDEDRALATGTPTVRDTKETDTAKRRKSATISFLCDRDAVSSVATASFVGTDPEECAYFFEVRSQHACAGAEPHKPGSVGPGSVFAIILLIAVLVYFGGGIFYQRTVANQRGWRQLPNYSLWAGIWSFVSVRAILK